jgi:hypothetical protein
MKLHYDLQDAGWATVTVECGVQKAVMAASYDSLRDLASAASALVMNGIEATVVLWMSPASTK